MSGGGFVLTAIQYVVDVAPIGTGRGNLVIQEEISEGSWATLIESDIRESDFTLGIHTLTLPSEVTLKSSTMYRWYLDFDPTIMIDGELGLAYGAADPYTDGVGYVVGLSGAPSGSFDWVFALYGKVPLGFNATVGIIAANSGGGTGSLDLVALVPADEFAALFDTPHGAAEGLMLDAMDPDEVTAYGTNTSGGIEPADQAKVEYVGIPRIWPGATAIVYDAHTPANAAPLAGDAKLWYRPTYRTPYGA
jgi:hypothetical protein